MRGSPHSVIVRMGKQMTQNKVLKWSVHFQAREKRYPKTL